MRLFGYYRSTSTWRVRIVLGLKGLRCETVPVNIAPGADEQQAAGFEATSPMRQVPVLEIPVSGGEPVLLTQSVAICEYLESVAPDPPLLPADPVDRARVREIVEIVNSGIQPLQNLAVLGRVEALAGAAARAEWAAGAIARGLAVVEARAARSSRGFVWGSAPTLADAFVVPQLYNARRFGADVSRFPVLLAAEARAAEFPAFAAAHPDRQPDRPGGPS